MRKNLSAHKKPLVFPKIQANKRLSICHKDKLLQSSQRKMNIQQQVKPNSDLSCKSWCSLQLQSGLVKGMSINNKREIASLTKIVNFLTVSKLTQRFCMDLQTIYFRVTDSASEIGGTTANLNPGQWVLASDLLYGMMLPSGNDASLVLAQNFGAILHFERQGQIETIYQLRSLDLTQDYLNMTLYQSLFVKEMNLILLQNFIANTVFRNPHGSALKENFSTPFDLAKICQLAWKDSFFKKVVGRIQYSCNVKYIIKYSGVLNTRTAFWQNTNELLSEQSCKGIKTGYTQTAGDCLASMWQVKDKRYVIVVLGSSSHQNRFKDTIKIRNMLEQN